MDKKLQNHFDSALKEIEALMKEAFLSSGKINKNHPLFQAGLQNGHTIVRDYIYHGEIGLAFEHLVYMVEEPPLQISKECKESLAFISKYLGK